jgi:hypothetical protein
MTHLAVAKTANGIGNIPATNGAERAAGKTVIRKLFVKCLDLTTATQCAIGLKITPSSDTKAYLVHGTQRDTVATMGTRKYAGGLLHTLVSDSATSLVVDFEAGMGALNPVQAGDVLMVWDGAASVPLGSVVVDSVTWSTDQATINLTAAIGTAFSVGALVSSVIVDTVSCNPLADNYVKTSLVGSTFDETNYPVLVDRVGTDEETITLTVLDSTTYSVLSDTRGSLPNGQFATDYEYTHPDLLASCFLIQAVAWGGTHTAGEALQFQIHPAAVPVYVTYLVSAGAAELSGESVAIQTWLEGA